MEHIRKCPSCDSTIIYKSKYTMLIAEKNKSCCRRCIAKTTGFEKGHRMANTHSLSYKREYNLWRGIKGRCYNENFPRYKDYGGRGIKMDDKWINDPVLFCDYLKTIENYEKWLDDKSYTIDRINNDLGYIEGNLRFTDKSTQLYNTRLRKDNKYGCKGIFQQKGNGRYQLRIGKKYIGIYDTLEECLEIRESYINNFAE